MMYLVESGKSLQQLVNDLQQAVASHKFGILGTHNLRQSMANKGVAFDHECLIFEVCNPHQAKRVLEADMRVSMALPCRISLYEEGGVRKLATLKPTAMLAMFDRPDLQGVAQEVEQTIIAIMDEAAR